MAGRFDFKSPGAAAASALQDAMFRQMEQRRVQMLDGIAFDVEQRRAERERAAAIREAIVGKQADADRLAGIVGPGSDLTPEQSAVLQAGDYTVNAAQTIPSTRTVAPLGLPMPLTPQDVRDKMDERKIAFGYEPSKAYQRRQETFVEQQQRQAKEAAQAERDEQRRFRDEQAVAARTFQGQQADANRQARAEQSEADRELKMLIASMSQSQSAETRALGNELKRLQVQAASDKIDAQRAERESAAKAKTQGRSDVRELAQSLINDPALDRITGNIGATTPDLTPGAIDARARLTQLVNKLSLEGRSQLKGTGAISDFEARMLGAAVSAIDPRAGAEKVRQHLKAIAAVFSDGDGANNGPQVGERRTINGQLGEWDGKGWLAVGGGR
jgi:hypothetical protein